MPRALLSVSAKEGVVDLARGLVDLGWEILSTGGTARALRDGGVAVTDVSAVTGHPEMMEGRVKTLHPAVHAGLLARRARPDDMEAMAEQGYEPIDLVAVNLYPFREAVAGGADLETAMENVDIGGPSMLRSAAKNHRDVLVVVDPADYDRVLAALRGEGASAELRLELARKVFRHTSAYDAAIAGYLEGGRAEGLSPDGFDAAGEEAAEERFPEWLDLRFAKLQALRYGENPDQPAAFYGEVAAPVGSVTDVEQLHGKELSFNNLLDVDAAAMAISAWPEGGRPACVIIKHTTPCGVALGEDPADAYRRALAGDPVSAFGGIVALNTHLTLEAADAMNDHFLEVVVAPTFDEAALGVLTRKKNLRLLRLPITASSERELDFKRVRGGLLVQRRMAMSFPGDEWRVASKRQPTENEWRDLRFAWRVAAAVKSNAIVLAKEERTVGIGAGQMSRVDSSRIAVMKAADRGVDLAGAALASDAFFPFRDGVDAAAEAGVRAVIQPGGSVRDEEVIAAADEHGMTMVLTGRRVFRH